MQVVLEDGGIWYMLSIIVPYYNNPREQISRCIKSLLENGYDDMEIIVVNDGSSEACKQILKETASADSRIRVITQENEGPSSARNTGLREAAGDYIMFVDADDELLAGVMASGMQILLEEKLDLLIGEVVACTEQEHNNGKWPEAKEPFEKKCLKVYEADEMSELKALLIYNSIEVGKTYVGKGPVARIIRRDLCVATPFRTDLTIGEDMVWNQELIAKCRRVGVEEKLWYKYFYNEQSVMHRFTEDVVSQYERQFQYLRKEINLRDDRIFYHYCRHVSDGLVHVYLLLWSRKEWKASTKERIALKKHLFEEKPWTVLASQRFYDLADRREKIKCFLYRRKLFFLALRMQLN